MNHPNSLRTYAVNATDGKASWIVKLDAHSVAEAKKETHATLWWQARAPLAFTSVEDLGPVTDNPTYL